MPEYLNLLSEIAGQESEGQEKVKFGKFRTSIITTYSAYLPFYENVVLRRLLASGCRYNILLVDAHDLARSLQDPTRMPRLAGRGYILVPMLTNGIFHPKIVMLLGDHKARILVGSHNMTLSGFGYNRELTTRIDIGRGFKGEHRAFFQQAWTAIEGWTNFQRDYLPQKLLDAILRIGVDRSQWLRGNEEQKADTIFLSSLPEGESLWKMVLPYLPESLEQILVLGPFFDRAGAFIRRLHDDFAPHRIAIGVDAEAENICLCKQGDLPSSVSFHNGAALIADVDKRKVTKPGYLHAKALFFDAPGGNSVLITGSANPSAPAWLAAPSKRNAEAIVLHRGNRAKELANALGILKVPELPRLGAEQLEELYTKALSHGRSFSTSPRRPLVAESVEGGLVIPRSSVSSSDIATCLVFFEDQSSVEPDSVSEHTNGLFIELEGNLSSIIKVVLTLIDGKTCTLFVHNPGTINKLATTSRQQSFQDALVSLGGDCPDFATLFRITDRLIFDESKQQEVVEARVNVSKTESQAQKEQGTSLGALSVPLEETKHQQRRQRELHHGDLAFVIDALIYNLGIGLHDAGERIEDIGLNEEEQVGKEDELKQEYAPEITKETLLKICHGKVRTLVNRMCKRFDIVDPDTPDGLKATEQLLAVLAVFREVRANDCKLSQVTEGESLIPLKERRKLLEAALKALFGNKKNLFDKVANIFKNDPENDMPNLLGLIIWLAWDSGLNVRNLELIPRYEEEIRRKALLELSKLFVIAHRAGDCVGAFAEANHSAWRVCSEETQPVMILWMRRYEKWAKKLSKIICQPDTASPAIEPECGQLGIAIRENFPRVRVILGTTPNKVQLAELSRDNNEIVFRDSAVRVVPMPVF